MDKIPVPERIPYPNPYYRGRIDPFFVTLDNILTKNDDAINRVLTAKDGVARAIGVFATLLLHPKVNIAFIAQVAKKYELEKEFSYLARMAMQLVDDGVSLSCFETEFARFKESFEKNRRPQLERLARAQGTSSIDRFTYREFRKHYEVYGHFVYNGTTTSPFPQGT